MAKSKEQERIVALQKQLSIARGALQRAQFGDLSRTNAEMALEEMQRIEMASKPNLVQEVPTYLGRMR